MVDEIFSVFPEINTERLNLRGIRQEDAESIYKLLSNPEVIKYDTLDVNRIEATVSTKNIASIRLLEKLGFIKEGILRERSYWRGSCHDMIMLSVLKKEYLITTK